MKFSLVSIRVIINVGLTVRHVRPPRLRGSWRFFISQLLRGFFHATPLFFTLYDLARIIELSSAQLDRTEIADFAPVS